MVKGYVFMLCYFLHFRILTDSFLGPMQEKLEEWKKTANQLEKDHSKGTQIMRLEAARVVEFTCRSIIMLR